MSNDANAATTKRKRCVLFCRGATEEIITRQAAELEEHAKVCDFDVIDCIRHLGAMPVDLPGDLAIELLLGRKAGSGAVDAMLITEWSRLTRRGAEYALWLQRELTEAGIKLIVAGDQPTPPGS